MKFERGHLYHVYNRGNNRGKIFFTQANYQFFVEKIDYHIVPYADVLGWCLMPNHFHLMIYVNRESIFSVSINQSIGKMLCSYARAVNIQENRTGSLFQQHTRAVCLNSNNKIMPSWHKSFGAAKINSWKEELEYPRICLDYIHLNPVNAGLVMDQKDWRWSSYHEIYSQDPRFELVNLDKLKIVVRL
jgi:putative transposase